MRVPPQEDSEKCENNREMNDMIGMERFAVVPKETKWHRDRRDGTVPMAQFLNVTVSCKGWKLNWICRRAMPYRITVLDDKTIFIARQAFADFCDGCPCRSTGAG